VRQNSLLIFRNGKRETMKESIKNFVKIKWPVLAVVCIMVIGFAMRLYCCFWGYPEQLHVDEPVVVEAAERMLENCTYEVDIYYRPDHFEIKCDAALFALAAKYVYHQPIAEAFAEHTMAFYLLARLFTTVVGTLLIPLVALLAARIMRDADKIKRDFVAVSSALLTGTSLIFVQHSAYATPDVVLAFFVVLFAYLYVRYMEEGQLRYVIFAAATIGAAATVKYPAMILCMFLAGMVIYRTLKLEHKPVRILSLGCLSIAVLVATVFVIAPNMITNFKSVWKSLTGESGGITGFTIFMDNARFYFISIVDHWSILALILCAVGAVYAIRQKNRVYSALAIGPVFLLCLTALSLRWVRWAIPFYPFYLILVNMGIVACFDCAKKYLTVTPLRKVVYGLLSAVTCLLLVSAMLTGICIVKFSRIADIRVDVAQYWQETEMNDKNTIFEGPTPDELYMQYRAVDDFVHVETTQVKREYATKSYFSQADVFSKSYDPRHFVRPSHARRYEIYQSLNQTYQVVKEFIPDGNYGADRLLTRNIVKSIGYLTTVHYRTGDTFTIYDLNPFYFQMQSKVNDEYIYVGEDAKLHTSEDIRARKWVLYTDHEGKTSIIFTPENQLLTPDGEGVVYADMEEDGYSGWTVTEVGEYVAIVSDEGTALTLQGEDVLLLPYEQSDAQLFRIVEE